MANVYKQFSSIYNQEKARLDRKIAVRQETPQQGFRTPLTVAAVLLGLGVSSLIIGSSEPKDKLEDHPRCGITTGGKAECYFDCELFDATDTSTYGQIISNLECLQGCFVNKTTNKRKQSVHCLNSLLKDVLENGICNYPDTNSPDCEFDDNFVLTEDTCAPSLQGFYPINGECEIEYDDFGYPGGITKGTCSEVTEELLVDEACINEVFEQPGFIFRTLLQLILNSCSDPVSEKYIDFERYGPSGPPDSDYEGRGSRDYSNYEDIELEQGFKKIKNRYAPTQVVIEIIKSNLSTRLDFENTRHRYPWVCSLRTRGASPEHLCAVTLLSIPPKPTVVVGAAHCTYICKNNEEIAIPVCCCLFDGVQGCADDISKCGDRPSVYEMTSRDIEILCGEWETGDTPMEFSGEEYNVLLPIKEIVRHPNFNAIRGVGPIGGSDIAIFKVDDSSIKNKTSSLRLYPICLPSAEKTKPGKQTGILAAWSKPPPFHFLEKQATGYLRLYKDFFKLWHYKVDIEICRDPTFDIFAAFELEFPSNTFYPPGTVCAKEFSRTCFTSGESGSPLMVTEKTRPMRFYAEGILSFVKGCDVLNFGAVGESNERWQLNQQTENPHAYTKLSCFLPWVAKQYDLDYKSDGPTDPACFEGQGEPLDVENYCTITPSSLSEVFPGGERQCIFPFYYNYRLYDSCILSNAFGFFSPVFRCPTRETTKKIEGINSYLLIELTEGLCPADPFNSSSLLDPDFQNCSPFARRPAFQTCKNNCPGVGNFGLIGGGATLAFLGATSALQSLVPVAFGAGAIGVAGLGGNMVAQMMCFSPYCRTISGRCCLFVFSLVSGVQCPDTC